ncbi:IS4 family transposase, partial [Catenulispora sp. NF23]|nr:IS4 family transposase [Catenulispora pinistramenti]
MALVETGTRAVMGAVFGPDTVSELDYARQLFPLLTPDMLVLADRAFDADTFLDALAETQAQFLIRIRISRRPPVVAVLPDGSFLTVIEGRTLRVVRATVAARLADGTAVADTWCLITTLTCHRTDPAG